MTRKPTGRVTPRKGATPVSPDRPTPTGKWEVRQSRSVRSGWVWRGFMMLALLALGVALIMVGNHHSTLALLWVVIAVGWFATAMWLWRQHHRYLDGA
ncbi:MAG: hypothetical protein KGQ66_08170 [Acidobacteriota bacterium]|nr:hypothetical protein [Acidobacteriota bacterium]